MAKKSNDKLKYSLIAIGAVIVILILIVVVKAPTSTNPNAADTTASSSLVSKLTSISSGIFKEVGVGTSSNPPKAINGQATTQDGKPQIIYIGAEYCPYCATERWAVVTALSRFGSFSNLKLTHSSSTDVYPNTQTFSFHGSSYTSAYIVFSPTEVYSNIVQGNGYASLDKPTAADQNIQNVYDSPPYVSSSNSGAIPFIYFGGKYLISGATYSPTLLQGKTADQIASALSDPNNAITKGVVGAANVITAAVCGMTKNQPTSVCTPDIQAIEATL